MTYVTTAINRMELNIMTLSKKIISQMTLSRITIDGIAMSRMMLSKMTISTLYNTQQNDTIKLQRMMLSQTSHKNDCRMTNSRMNSTE
jgi:hypothetical protein